MRRHRRRRRLAVRPAQPESDSGRGGPQETTFAERRGAGRCVRRAGTRHGPRARGERPVEHGRTRVSGPVAGRRTCERARREGIACRRRARRRLRACRQQPRRGPHHHGRISAPHRRQVVSVRRPAAVVRRQEQGDRKALAVRSRRISRTEQISAAVYLAARGQRRGAAHRQPSGSRLGSVDVDAGHRAGSPDRIAGPIDPVLWHRLQLRGSRGARRRPVRLLDARQRHHRRRRLLEDRVDPEDRADRPSIRAGSPGSGKTTTRSPGSTISSRTKWSSG